MEVIYGLNKLKKKNYVITMGVFDGVHRGHQKVICVTVKRAHQLNLCSMVITFDLHPKNIISSRQRVYLLTTLEQKKEMLKKMGIDVMLVINFNRKIVSMSSQDFVRDILWNKIGSREIIVGYNFSFGYQRTGNIDDLKKEGDKYNIKVKIIPPFKVGNMLVSSTKIRHFLEKGEITMANRLLGYYYRFGGYVIKGKGKGKKWDIPTANLSYSKDVILPEGVYLVNVFHKGNQYKGIANIGFRPTLYQKERRKTVEIYILKFDKNIYGEKLEVELIKKIRDEKKFSTSKELTSQIIKNINYAQDFFFKG